MGSIYDEGNVVIHKHSWFFFNMFYLLLLYNCHLDFLKAVTALCAAKNWLVHILLPLHMYWYHWSVHFAVWLQFYLSSSISTDWLTDCLDRVAVAQMDNLDGIDLNLYSLDWVIMIINTKIGHWQRRSKNSSTFKIPCILKEILVGYFDKVKSCHS